VHFGIRHLDDRILEVKWDRIIKPGDSLVIRGEGLPVFQPRPNTPANGDIIIRFDVVYPGEYLDPATKQAIRTAIPNGQSPPGQTKSMNINMQALYEQIRINPVLRENIKIIEPEISPEVTFSGQSGHQQTTTPDFEPAGGFSFIPGGIPGMGGGDMPAGVQCAQQ